jgi:hypothetical protein
MTMFRRLGLTFLATACLSGLAVAQTSATPSAAQLRLDEIRTELAWNADPLTFPYPLVAVCDGSSLKVYGGVPSNVVATQALKTARENTCLDVLDMLTIRPSLKPAAAPESAAGLENAAVNTLKEAFPHLYRDLSVKADESGRVAVGGSLPSYEECRAVSRRLKQVRGCTAVVNQVQVATAVVQDRACVRVTADGRLVMTAPSSPPQAGVVKASITEQQPPAPAAPPTSLPQTSPKTQVSPWQLKRAVERACGMAARQVQVTGAPGGGLHVRVKVRTEQDGQRLFDKLMSLPELAPHRVQFVVQVEP